jgi:hypothetical protein
MNQRTEKDFWIEMSVREIWTQAHFAELAYKNINPKAANATDAVFPSIHSFLSHCAMISKMLLGEHREDKEDYIKVINIGHILNIMETSLIHNRKFRNSLEHYDERLKKWIHDKGVNANIGTYNIGPKAAMQIPDMVYVSHYDPNNSTYTFVDEDTNLEILYQEVLRIKNLADKWVKTLETSNRSTF